MKGDDIVSDCDRHSNEILTPSKYVNKYKHMRKLMAEFLRKLESRVIKNLLQLTQFASPKLLIWFNFIDSVASR